jgi:hypothetical protein
MENQKKIKKKPKEESIIIPRTAFIAIMGIIPLTGILLSKGRVGTLIVLIIGVTAGIFIGKGFFEK